MALTAALSSLTWYYIKDYVDLFIPVCDVSGVVTPGVQVTFTTEGIDWVSNRYDVSPPTGKGINQQIAQNFRTNFGWTKEAESQWVSHAIAPDHFKHLTRTSTDTQYLYWISENKRFGEAWRSTVRFDTVVWVKDSTGKIFPTGYPLEVGQYAVPYMTGGTPGNNLMREATSTSYGITNSESLYGQSGWKKPSKTDWEYFYYYATAFLNLNQTRTRAVPDYVKTGELDWVTDAATEYIPNDDPYGDDGDGSGGFGGGGGDGSRESWDDTIGVPDMPGLTLGSLGSMGIFTPSASQLTSFFQYLWSDAFSVDGFKKIMSDPMQAIISLHALPCAVGAGASAEVAFGNISTGVSMPRVSSEWLTVDCGSIPFKKYYGSFFDYSPYTKYQIYLPYIGYKDISPDDFVGGDCHVVYHVHVPSGACMCYLISGAVDGSVLYQFGGSCLMQLPITSGTYNNFIGSVMTGLASGASALGNISSVAGKVASGALSAAASASSAVASLGSVLSSKPTVSRSGTISGAAGWMARQIPYVIRTRPNAVLTENLNSFQGYPLYRSRMLSQMSGYTVVEDIHLSGLSATADEADEIERLLKEGVIF